MINKNTLIELNNIGIGANISKLESYIVDYRQASMVADTYEYEYSYNKMKKIFKELKPSSVALTDKALLKEESMNEYDTIFQKYANRTLDKVYGITDENTESITKYIRTRQDECIDFVAICNIRGLNIKCTYVNGYVYRIDLIGEDKKYTDITLRFRNKLQTCIEEFKDYKIVELRGKLTIFNNEKDKDISLNTICSTMHLLRMESNDNALNMVFDDIIIDNDEVPFENQWDKIEYMRSVGLSVPHHALIRGIEEDTLEQAFNQFREFFRNLSDSIIYDFNGYIIRDNNKIFDDFVDFIYVYNKCDYKQIFYSKLKSISSSNENEIKLVVKLVPLQCNDELTIDSIDIQDINVLNTYELKQGEKIYFTINGDKAVLHKNINQ